MSQSESLSPRSRIHQAIRDGDIHQLTLGLKTIEEMDLRDLDICLMKAVENEQLQIVQYLIDYQADVNCHDGEPLYEASRYGMVDVVRCLLDNKADATINNSEALQDTRCGDYTSQEDMIEIIGLLLDHGANIQNHDAECYSYLAEVVREGYDKVVRYLVERGVTTDYDRPFQSAIYYNHLEIAKYLLDCKSDINTDNGDLLKYACSSNHIKIVEFLIDNKADVNIDNGSALQRAQRNGWIPIAQLLILHGAAYSGTDHLLTLPRRQMILPLLHERLKRYEREMRTDLLDVRKILWEISKY